MGNYNCQECITKEVNIINELLLDTNLLSPEEPPIEETRTYESKIKPKKNNKSKPKEEDLKKLIVNKDLSEDQKQFLEKIIDKNSFDLYINNKTKQEEQKKLIERQKEQILSQQKIIEKYKQSINFEKEKNENQNQEDNIPDVKITTLEPPKNITQEKIPQDVINKHNNNEAIVIQNSPNSEEEINDIKDSYPQDENDNEDTQGNKKYQNENYEIIYDNNNINNLFDNNDRENEPQDSIREDFRKPIIPKGTNDINKNKNKTNKIKKESGPRDSLKKKLNTKDNNIHTNNNKSKIPVNKYEINNNDINNNINKNNQKYLSPFNNELVIKEINNNNMININENNNYEEQRNALTFGPYLNEVDEIKNAYTAGNVMDSINNDNNQNEMVYTQITSQKDMEMTISDKENPLHISGDKGNMNYLEDKYEAYKNRMRYNYED